MLKQHMVLPFLDVSCPVYTNKQLYNQNKQINIYLYCNELHIISALFWFCFQRYTQQVFMFGINLVPTSLYKLKKKPFKLNCI